MILASEVVSVLTVQPQRLLAVRFLFTERST
jgi:hypothetical protein